MRDLLKTAASQVCDACSGCYSRTDCAAKCRQSSDACFLVDRYQIGECQRTVHFFIAALQFLCILDNRHGTGNALISAAGIDDNRKLTAAHPCIRARRCHGTGAVADLISICIQHDPSDTRTVGMRHSLLSDRHVTVDLMIEDRSHILYLTRHREIPDVLHIQKASVSQTIFLVSLHDRLQQLFTVALLQHDIRVIVCNPHLCRIFPCKCFNDDIKNPSAVQIADFHVHLIRVCAKHLALLIADLGDDLQLPLRSAGHKARRHSGLDSFHAAGVRHNDGFYIFDDTATHFYDYFFRQFSKQFPASRSRIRKRDRLRTPHRRDQLFF